MNVLKYSLIAMAVLASLSANGSVIEIGDNASGGSEVYPGSHIAIGDNANVQFQGIAIGGGATTTRGLSVGTNARSLEYGSAFGEGADARGYGSTAIGAYTYSSAGSFAGGNQARAEGLGSVVIGELASSSSTAINSVVLGKGSTTDDANVVSVGSSSIKRRISNMAFGKHTNDGVVYDQIIPALSTSIFSLGGGAYYNPLTGEVNGPTYNLSMGTFDNVGAALLALDGLGGAESPFFKANGTNAASALGSFATAGGHGSEASNYGSTAYGSMTEVGGDSSSAFGHQAKANADNGTALGSYAQANARCVALGSGSECDEDETVSIGRPGNTHRIVNVSNGINNTDAVNMGQVRPIGDAFGAGSGYGLHGNFTPPAYVFQSGNVYTNVADGLYDLDGRVSNLESNPGGGGVPGPVGPQGPQGTDGAKGDKGDQGERGEKGDRGDQGDKGDMGADGQDGADGRDGNDGAKGDKGDQGVKGDAGRDGVDGGGAGIPGAKGDKGDAGADGRDGNDGRDGTNGASGQDGTNGTNGADGAKGDQGVKGDAGRDGVDGIDGVDGRDGTNGQDGADGADGQDGADGVNGADGAKGDQGDKGDAGTNGTNGIDGAKGADGKDGSGDVEAGENISVERDGEKTTVSLKDNVLLSDQGSIGIQNGPSLTQQGIDAGNHRITNVAPGRIEHGSTDAVNGGQVWALEDRWDRRFDNVEKRIDGLGAQMGAMTMMAGTPGDGGLAVGIGASGSKTALAIGTTRRISENVSMSAGVSFGGGNKPVVGVGFRFGGQ